MPPPHIVPSQAMLDAQHRPRSGAAIWLALLMFAGIAVLAIRSDALYGMAAAVVSFMDASPQFPQSLFYLALGAVPVTLIHELGHALTARRLLGTPVHVAVGSVGKIAEFELGRISVSLNALGSPTRVAGSATFDASRARAGDILLIALTGPAASAVGLLVSLAMLSASPTTGFAHGVIWATVLGGAFAVLNLIPFAYQERRGGPRMHTDGRLALDAARALHSLR
jgi:hypothetical protein